MVKASSAYAKRNSLGVAAPMEVDSDSDFDTRMPSPEPVQKAKGKRKSSGKSSKSSRQKSLGEVRRAELVEVLGPHKPLASYFDKSLGLCSGSEVEDAEEQEDEDYNAAPPENGTKSRNLDVLLRKPSLKKAQNTPSRTVEKKPWTPNTPWHVSDPDDDKHWQGSDAEDESATESEPEVDLSTIQMKRRVASRSPSHSPPKRRKVTPPQLSGSSTESESELDLNKLPAHTKRKVSPSSTSNSPSERRKVAPQLSGSSTESESEFELPSKSSAHKSELEDNEIRPNPALFPGVKTPGPFLLGGNTKVPAPINMHLRDYQREGVEFLFRQYKEGRGGWLGDDMGLGKTIQVIAFLAAIMHKSNDKRDKHRRRKWVSDLQGPPGSKQKHKLPPANSKYPTALVIAPSSVVLNWEREFEKWGHFEVGLYSGSSRKDVLKEFAQGRLDVLLVSFDIALRDIELLWDLALSVVIVDEAHKLKNRHSKITQALHRFDCVSRFGLSGTIIQNKYEEMYTTLDWTNPGRLGESKDWKGYIVKPLTAGQSSGATEAERATAHSVALTLRHKILPELFLRRTKDIIQSQLPKKNDLVVFCPLSAKQVEVYEKILQTDAVQNMIRKDDMCDCGSKLRRGACHHQFEKSDIFTYISILIKIANHLALTLPAPKDTAEQIERNRTLSFIAFPDSPAPKFDLAMMSEELCGKWAALNNLLRSWRDEGGNKVLIFTKSVKLLDMLEHHLNRQSYSFRTLKGAVKFEDRMPMIDEFQTNPEVFVFLISTLAGGTGLNLTAANKVVIFDPNWNPAHDLQAMDRAYRIGQARDVDVYRLLGSGSVEELIYARQLYKQQQMHIGYTASLQTRYFKGVQGDTSKQGELFGLKNIFKLHKMDTVATKDLIEDAHLAEFSWALANTEGAKGTKKNEYKQAETKAKTDENFSGLGALLFDDYDASAPSAKDVRQHPDTGILERAGIAYTHNNDQILQPSKAAEHQLLAHKTKVKEASRRKAERKKNADADPEPEEAKPVWPPLRGRAKQKKPMDPLTSRTRALVELNYIDSHDDLAAFAVQYKALSESQQRELMERLDSWKPRN